MGLTLHLETSTSEEIPPEFGFSHSDSKSLLFHLAAVGANDDTNDLVKLLNSVRLTIAPLTRMVAYDEEPLENFMARDPTEWRRQHWEREHAAREAAWQTPAAMLTALDALLNLTNSLSPLLSKLNTSDDYFRDGTFSQDLIDLREMIRWAEAQQVPFVRLVLT
jgi:hypothetical protein